MLRKIENGVAVVLVALLAVLPLLLKVLQSVFRIAIPDGDIAAIHFVFMFACLAGLITWREDRHLSLASLTERLPEKARNIVLFIRNFFIVLILTELFFASFGQLVNPAQFSSTAWGISLRFFYFFLPLCYIAIVLMISVQKKNLVAAVIGIVVGLVCAVGPITGILYYVFGIEYIPSLYALNDAFIAFTFAARVPFVLLFIVLAFFGMPLFLVFAGIAYILFSGSGGYVDIIPLETYRILSDRSIAAIPLFTIAGYILAQSSAGKRFVEMFKALFGWFRGGTVIAAVIVATFFSTFTGVSGVTILALGPLLSVVLKGSGYSEDTAESLVTSSGAIGLLFPPSAAIIMYATVNYFSVDVIDLFKGALIPGIIMALAMMTVGIVKDRQTARPSFSWNAIAKSLLGAIPELLMPLLISFFFFRGVLDLFEVAAFAVFYAIILSTIIRRDFSFEIGDASASGASASARAEASAGGTSVSASASASAGGAKRRSIFSVIVESVPVSGGVLFILGAASGISYFMLDANVPYIISDFVMQFVTSPYVFLILMNLLLLVVGCLMDMFSAILIVSPLLLPLAESFGIDAVRASVIFLMNLSIGFLTPPVGMDLFIASYTFNKPMSRVIRGIVPFLLVQLAVLLFITYVPWVTHVLL